MRSLNMLNGALVSFVLAISAVVSMIGCASAEGTTQETTLNASTTVTAIHETLSSMQPHQATESFHASDMLLAMIAGIVLVVLQLRRHQKAQSDTRIISLNHLHRFNHRAHPIAKAKMSPAAESDLIAHAERG